MLKQLIHKGKQSIRAVYSQEPTSAEDPSVRQDIENNQPSKTVSPIVAVLGAKGGNGATTVAINLAAAMASKISGTTLIDSNFQHPDIATVLGKELNHSVVELFTRAPDIDPSMFEACRLDLGLPNSSLGLLSPPLDGATAVTSTLTTLSHCLDSIKPYSRLWVIDLCRHLDRHLVTLTDKCDKIVLVLEANVSSIAACKRWISAFRELGYGQDRIVCVLNRSGAKPITVEQELGICFAEQPIFKVPNAHALLSECATRGVPAVVAYPNHAYSQALKKLANIVIDSVMEDKTHV